MTPAQFVKHAENTLGTDISTPLWKCRARETAKLTRWLDTHPGTTMHDLLLAVEYCRTMHVTVRTPLGVTYYIPDATARTHRPAPTDAREQARQDALTVLAARTDADAAAWMTRLQRADGDGLDDVLAEYHSARPAA
jgi:hypothetical protein